MDRSLGYAYGIPAEDDRSHPASDDHSHPAGDDRSHPASDDRNHPASDDHSHPAEDDHSHPAEDDHNHPAEDDHNHPAEDDRNHPAEDDRSHPAEDDRSHPAEDDRSHPADCIRETGNQNVGSDHHLRGYCNWCVDGKQGAAEVLNPAVLLRNPQGGNRPHHLNHSACNQRLCWHIGVAAGCVDVVNVLPVDGN